MTPLLTILAGFLLAPFIAGLTASVLCSLHILRDRKPPWYHAFVSIAFGTLSASLVIFRGDVFRPGGWPDRLPGQWDPFVIALGAASLLLTVVVVLIAVALFRERFKKHLSRRERLALRRLRRRLHWRRVRWFHLLGSSALIVGLTGCLLCLHYPRVPLADTSVVSDYLAAYEWGRGDPASTPPQRATDTPKPLLEITPAAGILSPPCVLGLVAAGAWLAFTITFWRGYVTVRPRHRRDLLVRYRF